MLAMSYDCALRREELCNLETGDIDPAHRMVRIRAENTKGRRERVVPYSEATSELYARYLGHRRQISRDSRQAVSIGIKSQFRETAYDLDLVQAYREAR